MSDFYKNFRLLSLVYAVCNKYFSSFEILKHLSWCHSWCFRLFGIYEKYNHWKFLHEALLVRMHENVSWVLAALYVCQKSE